MAKLITTTTTYHPNIGYTDTDSVTVEEFPSKKEAIKAGKKAFKDFLTCEGDCDEEDFEGTTYAFGELKKSPNSAFADDTDNGIVCHWYVID